MEQKFKVGDVVKASKGSNYLYSQTSEINKWVGIVERIEDNGKFLASTKSSLKGKIGEVFDYLNMEYFELVTEKPKTLNTEFIVGHQYVLRPDYSVRIRGEDTTFEGRETYWAGVKYDGISHNKPATCTQVSQVSNNKKTQVMFKEVKSGFWCYWTQDFIDVTPTKEESTTKQTNEGRTMDMKEIKKTNLKEAKKQFDTEKKNAEIEFAKTELRRAVDKVNDYDRQIKQLEEQKKPHLEIIKMFSD